MCDIFAYMMRSSVNFRTVLSPEQHANQWHADPTTAFNAKWPIHWFRCQWNATKGLYI